MNVIEQYEKFIIEVKHDISTLSKNPDPNKEVDCFAH